MTRRTDLAAPYDQGSFGVTTARAQGDVVARVRWLTSPFYGVRSHDACDDLSSRAAALQTVLPARSAFSHQTAAQLLGLPIPSREDGAPLEVMTPSDRPLIRHRGVRGHRGLESRNVRRVDGLRLTGPVDVWLDLAAELSLDDLVILGDAIAAKNPALCAELQTGASQRAQRRGVGRAREAIEWIRPHVRSPMETRTRLLLVRGGLPEPEVNAEICDQAHTWLAEVDLVWRERKVIVEYDGLWHAERGQRRLDAARRRQLRAEGWIVVELYAEDVLRHPEHTIWMVHEALAGHLVA